ncbi:UDP-glucose 4-epimerase-like [Neocloeon triangulifer]|uniref:UDP-glucose 4-epimerase-like n=1 Tax=Neocloeon triangulifer TaxID=2078957 RepID=UPI00286EEAB9|nr:UDP-glucose 4-epimerase-like [Neocloeon triangulifer]
MVAEVLVTGGAGFVGSHTVLVLLQNGFKVVVLDNLVNAVSEGPKPEALVRVEKLAKQSVVFYEADLCDSKALDRIFTSHSFQCVIHFAALKAVGESCQLPLSYYRNNVAGTLGLLEAMKKHKVNRLVFSSSATVYGTPQYLPLDEAHPTGQGCTNPYGRSKFFIEEMLADLCRAEPDWQVISLRYFNPVGAHPSGQIGEDPLGIPNNLMPFVSQVAIGKRKELQVYGDDYETPDGTGVRDYIHIMDLADGHVAALERVLGKDPLKGFVAINLGTGRGNSVLEVVAAFEKASGKTIKYKVVERRAGDVATSYADPKLAKELLSWSAKKDILDMCKDAWNWQMHNPNGFRSSENQK